MPFVQEPSWGKFDTFQHHCPKCKQPLSHPAALRRCIGKHVMPCDRFHEHLTHVGSNKCGSCASEDKMRKQRVKGIGDVLRQLKDEGMVVAVAVAMAVPPTAVEKDRDRSTSPTENGGPPALCRKSRKELKKQERALHRGKTAGKMLTDDEIDAILHTEPPKDESQIPDILVALGYDASKSGSASKRGKDLVKKLEARTREDLEAMAHLEAEMKVRKEAFERFAGRDALGDRRPSDPEEDGEPAAANEPNHGPEPEQGHEPYHEPDHEDFADGLVENMEEMQLDKERKNVEDMPLDEELYNQTDMAHKKKHNHQDDNKNNHNDNEKHDGENEEQYGEKEQTQDSPVVDEDLESTFLNAAQTTADKLHDEDNEKLHKEGIEPHNHEHDKPHEHSNEHPQGSSLAPRTKTEKNKAKKARLKANQLARKQSDTDNTAGVEDAVENHAAINKQALVNSAVSSPGPVPSQAGTGRQSADILEPIFGKITTLQMLLAQPQPLEPMAEEALGQVCVSVSRFIEDEALRITGGQKDDFDVFMKKTEYWYGVCWMCRLKDWSREEMIRVDDTNSATCDLAAKLYAYLDFGLEKMGLDPDIHGMR